MSGDTLLLIKPLKSEGSLQLYQALESQRHHIVTLHVVKQFTFLDHHLETLPAE